MHKRGRIQVVLFLLILSFRFSHVSIVKLGPIISDDDSMFDINSGKKIFLLPNFVPDDSWELFAFSVLLSSTDQFSLLFLRPKKYDNDTSTTSNNNKCGRSNLDLIGQFHFTPTASVGSWENVYLESYQLNQGCARLSKGDRFGIYFQSDPPSISSYIMLSNRDTKNDTGSCGDYILLSSNYYNNMDQFGPEIQFDALKMPYTFQVYLYFNYDHTGVRGTSTSGSGSSNTSGSGSSSGVSGGSGDTDDSCTGGLLIPRSMNSNVTTRTTVLPNYKGVQGAKGATGLKGPPGFQGNQGPQGIKGIPGAIGQTGPMGMVGGTGLAGHIGRAGSTGATGYTGATGPQGSTGVIGSPGEMGDTGEPGHPGKNYTKIIGKKITGTRESNLGSITDPVTFFDSDIAIIALFIWLPIISFLCLLIGSILIALCVSLAKY